MTVSTEPRPDMYANSNCMKLAAIPDAPSAARRFAKSILNRWNLPGMIRDAELVISEMVTNAVQHVGIIDAYPKPTYMQLQEAKLISVCLYRHENFLVIEVWDPSTEPPIKRDAEATDEGGRGLVLIEAFTEGWGYRRPLTGGKVVWCAMKTKQATAG